MSGRIEAARALIFGTGGKLGLDPCACGAARLDHTGAANSGGCPATGCRRYRRSVADTLAQRALAAADRSWMDTAAQWYARMQPRPQVDAGGWSVGPSDAGECRRRIWYRERPPEGFVPDVVDTHAADQGTLIHDGMLRARGGLFPWLRHEVQVRVPGLDRPGRLDEYDPVLCEVRDLKTAGDYLWRVVTDGSCDGREGHWEQVFIYALGLIAAGQVVYTVQLIYVHRESGQEVRYSRPYDQEYARRALGKLLAVLVALDAGTELPRDRRGPATDPICAEHCEARSHCWNMCAAQEAGRSPESFTILGPDPDPAAVEWAAEQYWAAKAPRREAAEAHAAAKALVQGLLPPGARKATVGHWRLVARHRTTRDWAAYADRTREAAEEYRRRPRGDLADRIAEIEVPTTISYWTDVEPVREEEQ